MKWGITFKIPATYEEELWEMPPVSSLQRLSRSDGRQTLLVSYHFIYPPQNADEWQRVAAIKIQIAHRIKRFEFQEYSGSEATGPLYTISELGREFPAFIRFPKPQYPHANRQAYKMLCRYAKRLHYYEKMHLEQLISMSFRFNNFAKAGEGPSQSVKRARSAYLMALKNRHSWPIKLSHEDRTMRFREAAHKTAQIKRADLRRNEAIFFRSEGKKLTEIAYLLGISRATVGRWLKESMSH
jgi:hypothetical protein